MNSLREHIRKFPNARPETLKYLAKRDEKTEALKRYVDAKTPWWKKLLRRFT